MRGRMVAGEVREVVVAELCVHSPENSCVEVQTSSTSECECVWRVFKELIKMRSLGRALLQCDRCPCKKRTLGPRHTHTGKTMWGQKEEAGMLRTVHRETRAEGKPLRRQLQTFTWGWEVVGWAEFGNIFWSSSQKHFLMDWVCDVRESIWFAKSCGHGNWKKELTCTEMGKTAGGAC